MVLLIFKTKKLYFLTLLGLCCCWFFLAAGGFSLVALGDDFQTAVRELLISVDSLVVEYGLEGMWDSVVATHGP